MLRATATAVALLCMACPDDAPFPHGRDDGGVVPGEGISLHGRVVNFESCPIPPGCEPVEGMVVEVEGANAASDPTGPEGAFIVNDAPKERPLILSVAGGRGVDLSLDGGYVGQAIARIDPANEENRLCPDINEGLCAIDGVTATVRPADYGVVAYVNGLPSFVPEGPVVLPAGTDTTSTGIFLVLPGTPRSAAIDVRPTHPDMALPELTAVSIEPGAVTLGLHRAD